MKRRTALRQFTGLGFAAALLPLTACSGWRVKGSQLDFPFQRILVREPNQEARVHPTDPARLRFDQSTLYRGLASRLRAELRDRHKLTLVEEMVDAQIVLKISSIGQRKTVLSFSSGGQPRELELRLRLTYQAESAAGRLIVAPTTVELARTITVLETAVLATSNEEISQIEALESEVIQRIVRQLSALRDAPQENRSTTP